MPLIKCPDCGKDVSDSAPACICCGRPISQRDYSPEEIMSLELLNKKTDNKPSPGFNTFTDDPKLTLTAHKKTKSRDRLGLGCAFQGFGLLLGIATFFTIIGPIVGLVLFIFGGCLSRAKSYLCSSCGNEVVESSVVCPNCSTRFIKDPQEAMTLQFQIAFLIFSAIFIYASLR